MDAGASATTELPAATPLRALGTETPHGYRLIRDVESTYRDGAEAAVLRIVGAAADRSSGSDELIRSAKGWAQRYHLDPARANVIRALDLPAGARVLEIGAGCGAITRYLGEQCAVVDALEPVPSRAAVAAARTADLPGVHVVVGALEDVPAEPVYDVVVVIGVLEYVGAGSASNRPYLDFLADIRRRLVADGTLVLAIENKLGVKYLAGSPEDHTDRVFDSVEGYPRGGKARTFSRRELEGLLTRSGLVPETLIAFPDYKMTRAVFGDFPDAARSLLHRIPDFPSPDWRSPRPRMADERSLWAELVGAGLAQDFGNSFVVVADATGSSPLWPETRAGVFFSTGRRKHLEVRTEIRAVEDSVRFVRTPREDAHGPVDGIGVVASEVPYQAGLDLALVIAKDGPEAFGAHADRWLALLDEALARDDSSVVDLVPHNLVVGEDDGELHAIDLEFVNVPMTRDRVIRRGIFRLAIGCAPLTAPERWAPARTVGDLMVALGTLVGLPSDGSWIEATIHEEVDFLARVRPGPPTELTEAQWHAQLEARTRRRVTSALSTGPLGPRVWDRHGTSEAELTKARAESTRLTRELATMSAKYAKAEKARRRLARSPEQRAGRKLRRVADVVLPPNSVPRSRVRRWLGPGNSR